MDRHGELQRPHFPLRGLIQPRQWVLSVSGKAAQGRTKLRKELANLQAHVKEPAIRPLVRLEKTVASPLQLARSELENALNHGGRLQLSPSSLVS